MALPCTQSPSSSRSASRPDSQASDSPQTSRRLEVESIPHAPSFENLNYYARHADSHSVESDDDDHSSHETDSPMDVADRRQHFNDRQGSSKSSIEDRRREYGHYYGSEKILSRSHRDEAYRRSSDGIGGDRARPQRRLHTSLDTSKREWILMDGRRRDKTTGMCQCAILVADKC